MRSRTLLPAAIVVLSVMAFGGKAFGQTARVDRYPSGPGCSAVPGIIPTDAALDAGAPVIGSACTLEISESPAFFFPFTSTWLLIASAPTTSPTVLGSSCLLWADLETMIPIGVLSYPRIQGTGVMTVPIPQDPQLAGAALMLQAAWVNQNALVLTNGLKITLGF